MLRCWNLSNCPCVMGGSAALSGLCWWGPMLGMEGWDTRLLVMEAMRCSGDREVLLPAAAAASSWSMAATAAAASGGKRFEATVTGPLPEETKFELGTVDIT